MGAGIIYYVMSEIPYVCFIRYSWIFHALLHVDTNHQDQIIDPFIWIQLLIICLFH